MPVTTLYVGIDVSLKTNQVCSINFNQDVFFNQSFDNTPSGTETLIRRLLSVLDAHPELTKIRVCMEATNVYHTHVSSVLASDARMQAYDVHVYSVNALLIENYKRTFADRSKTDPEDAYLCADYVRIGKCKNLPAVIGYQKIALQRLTRQRKHIAEQLGIEKQYLSSNLYLKFSALKVNPEVKPFSNIFGKTSSVMLTDYLTNEEIVQADVADLAVRIAELSRNRCDNPEEIARLLRQVSANSYRLDKVASDSVTKAMASSFRMIQCYQDELKTLDKEILRLVESMDNHYYTILTSIKGIGHVYAAGIIAEITDIRYFPSHDKLASYCGLRWKRNQSGTRDSQHRRQPNSCNSFLRYYFVEATGSVIRNCPNLAAYYNRKRSEVKINAHKRALVLTSRKFVRIVFGLLRNNKLFDDHCLVTTD